MIINSAANPLIPNTRIQQSEVAADRTAGPGAASSGTDPPGREPAVRPVDQGEKGAKTSDQRSDTNRAVKEARQRGEERVEAKQLLQDKQVIEQIKGRDREVRTHEAAHSAVGGQYAGAPTYKFQRGPNGVNYAVGGEVSISTSEIAGDPEATLQKAQQVQRAALAPAEPSSQDRKVAAQASQMAQQARVDIAQLASEAAAGPVLIGEEVKSDDLAESEPTGIATGGSNRASSIDRDDSGQSETESETNSARDLQTARIVDVDELFSNASSAKASGLGQTVNHLV